MSQIDVSTRLLIFRKISTQNILIPRSPLSKFRKMFQSGHLLNLDSNKKQKQPPRGVLKKWCSENMQSNFIEIALRHECSPVNLVHIFRTLFPNNTSRRLLLKKLNISRKIFHHRLLSFAGISETIAMQFLIQ